MAARLLAEKKEPIQIRHTALGQWCNGCIEDFESFGESSILSCPISLYIYKYGGQMISQNKKPLGFKSYTKIAHLPGSRQNRDDIGITGGQARILTKEARDNKDVIIVQQKLDGSCVSIAKIDGVVVPMSRSGHRAESSPYEQFHHFAKWTYRNFSLFDFLEEGERVCGEWLGQAVGTIYELPHMPFVAFDIMRNGFERALHEELTDRIQDRIPLPQLLSNGPPLSIEKALSLLDPDVHGAKEEIEGAVWRVERDGAVDFLAKYVRHTKMDGKYLPEISGKPSIWLWDHKQ